MPKITSIEGRIIYNSRGSKTIEVDIISENKFLGRVCAPSGASVGKYEATSFPNEKPEESLRILNENSQKFVSEKIDNFQEHLFRIERDRESDNANAGQRERLNLSYIMLFWGKKNIYFTKNYKG